eukprot:scaffold7804_cov58-Attheya_sp.AAC.3
METMLAVGKSPRHFYFPLKKQESVIKGQTDALRLFQNTNSKEALLIALWQGIRFAEGGNAFVTYDLACDFFNREKLHVMTIETKAPPIPLLDERQSEIAGVKVRNLNEPITDRNVQRNIEEAISKLVLHIEYKRPRNLEWEKGKTPKQIEDGSTFVRRNKKMKADARHQIQIAWAADNPEMFSFAFGKKKDANSSQHVKTVLDYYDKNAATDCIQNIQHLKNTAENLQNARGVRMSDCLAQYNFCIKQEPQEVDAKVLPLPTLTFKSGGAVQLGDGSWNLNRVKFASPADMYSFAVIDLVGDSNRTPSVLSFLENQFKAMDKHGIELPANIGDLVEAAEDITVQCKSGEFDAIRQCVKRAIDKAKQYFLFDRAGHFRKNNVWFKTLARNRETGDIASCLVIPPNDQSDNLSIMLPKDVECATHQVTWNGGTPTNARLKVKVIIGSDNKQRVDPFDFRFFRNTHQAQNLDGVWHAAEFCGYSYELPPGSVTQYIDQAECTNVTPMINKSASDIECPSVLFAYLPNDDASTYLILKMVSKFDCGVQSQCAVATTFAKQRNPDQ